MELGKNLSRLRRAQGLSQEQVAEQIGVSRQAVSKWEADRSLPELEKLAALANLYGVTLDELAGREPTSGEGRADSAQSPPPACPGYGYGRYEYKSRRCLFGLPLVHINLGRGLYVAKGIVAIGNVACGVFSLGGAGVGLVSVGGCSLGLLALGGLALGGLTLGGLSIGLVALGGCAVGALAMGGLAVGQVAAGGLAVASHLAAGGHASAPVAVGEIARGAQAFHPGELSHAEALRLFVEAAPRYLGFAARALAGLIAK